MTVKGLEVMRSLAVVGSQSQRAAQKIWARGVRGAEKHREARGQVRGWGTSRDWGPRASGQRPGGAERCGNTRYLTSGSSHDAPVQRQTGSPLTGLFPGCCLRGSPALLPAPGCPERSPHPLPALALMEFLLAPSAPCFLLPQGLHRPTCSSHSLPLRISCPSFRTPSE